MEASHLTTGWMEWMSHRKQKEAKQQPGTAEAGNILGWCLVSLRFLFDIHSIHPLIIGLNGTTEAPILLKGKNPKSLEGRVNSLAGCILHISRSCSVTRKRLRHGMRFQILGLR